MCGRFTLRAPASIVAEQFSLFEEPHFLARFNIAPSQPAPVVRLRTGSQPPTRELVWLRWGLVPGWAKSSTSGGRWINARAETAAEKPAFRTAMRRRRCLIAADGFYEWQATEGTKTKRPYFIHFHDDRPFAIAGLWETWEGADHSMLETCVLLTTEANALLRPIHDRMPVILPANAYDLWLDPGVQDPQRLASLWTRHTGEGMSAYAVGSLVNRPAYDSPRCIEPAASLLP